MTFGSLFAGVGGMDLGLEWAGLRCKWQVEIDPYARKVLEKNWPNVKKRWGDVRTFPPEPTDNYEVDLICGGFPCQDISYAGKGAGIDGERSGLWKEFARIIRVLRPKYVLVENVPALLGRGLSRVLGDLATLRYDAEWDCLPAGAFGSHHFRDRLFVLACYSDEKYDLKISRNSGQWKKTSTDGGLLREGSEVLPWKNSKLPDWRGYWTNEPRVGRVAHGVPNRVHRLAGIGNAVVPQVTEWIGKRLMGVERKQGIVLGVR